jgi:large subunit ribosomal protein L6
MILNMVVGVTQGYQKSLEVHGTGYNVEAQKGKLTLRVGYSHDAVLDIPKGVEVTVEQSAAQPDNPAKFTVKGIDKQVLGQFAADIKAVRPPEPYKGKGIRYAGEYVRRKEGKAFAGIE